MSIGVFVSCPEPFNDEQRAFMQRVREELERRGLQPRTLGVNEYDNEVPLAAVRRMLLESNGVLAFGLRRYQVSGWIKPGSAAQAPVSGWFTSPWPHLETAMGYQLGLPIMVVREQGVHADGIFERGVVGVFVQDVDVAQVDTVFESQQWRQCLAAWERDVRTVVKNRGLPPRLY